MTVHSTVCELDSETIILRTSEMELPKDILMKTICVKGKYLLFQHVSILNWLPKYKKVDAISDVVAGFTVGLTLMPQSIAYASLAGLSAQYGLYSAFMGSLVYTVFGTIKEVSIGPTSLMALLTFQYTQDLSIEFVVLLSFLVGCMEFLMGVLNTGFLVNFISAPVTSGFTSATSVIIILAQIKGLIGISYKSRGTVDSIRNLFIHGSEMRLWDTVLGISCCIFLLSFRKLTSIPIGPEESKSQKQKIVKKTLWFISIARNALVVLLCSVMAFKLKSSGMTPFTLSGEIKPGLPSLQPPPFSAQIGNATYTFPEMCMELGSAIIVVPIVAVLANVAIAKAFTSGTSLNATQEMITLGLCNIFGSFVQAFPTCGAFTRSAVSNASGVRTPMMGLYSGTIILLALTFLTPYFYFIPRATLSAVLICAVMFMIEWEKAFQLWRSNKRDFFLMLLTFLSCVFLGVEVGLLLGITVDLIYLLYLWARPNIDVEVRKSSVGGEFVIATPDIGLPFAAVDFLRTEVGKIGNNQGAGTLPVAVNCKNFKTFDFTTAMGIASILKDFEKRKQILVFLNLKHEYVEMLHNAKVQLMQYCRSEEELEELLFGDENDLQKSVTLPILGLSQGKKQIEEYRRRESEGDFVPI